MAKFIHVTEDQEPFRRIRINIETIQRYQTEQSTDPRARYERTRIIFERADSLPVTEKVGEIDDLIEKANGDYVPIQENPFHD